MKRDQFFDNATSGARYLKTTDLPSAGVTWSIREVVEVQVSTSRKPKPAVFFYDDARGLILNETNWDALEALFGDDSDRWVGKVITVYVASGVHKGTPYTGMRIRAAQPEPSDSDLDLRDLDPPIKKVR